MAILRNLTGYLWPSDNPGLRARVVTALGLLVASKALSIQVHIRVALWNPSLAFAHMTIPASRSLTTTNCMD